MHCFLLLVNLACRLAMRRTAEQRPLRVGILDLDIFGPSVPGLMGLGAAEMPLSAEGVHSCSNQFNQSHYLKCRIFQLVGSFRSETTV